MKNLKDINHQVRLEIRQIMKDYFLGRIPKPEWLPEDRENIKKLQRIIAKAKSSEDCFSSSFDFDYVEEMNEEKRLI